MDIKIEEFNSKKHDLSSLKIDNCGQSHVFLEGDKIIGRANMFICTKEVYIGTIKAEVKGLGYGKRMIESIKETYSDHDLITGDSTPNSRGFWEKMGAVIDETYEDNFYIQIDPSKNIKPIF